MIILISGKILFLKNVKNEGSGLFGTFLKEQNVSYEVIEYYKNYSEINIEDYSSYIVLGGPMSANDDLDFIKKEISLIKQIILSKKPFLGICLGSQLLSKSLGGAVKKNPFKEIEVFNMKLTNKGLKSPLFNGISHEFKTFQWHGETFSIPHNANLLATSATCKNQALQYRNAIGLQFHIEFTPEMVKNMVDLYQDEFEENSLVPNDIIKEFDQIYQTQKDICKIILKNFLNLS